MAVIVLSGANQANAQGTFENLNFEDATIVPISGEPYAITVANALPDWTVNYGTVQQTQIYYNGPSLGETQATLNANGYPGTPGPILDDDFSLELQGGAINGVRTSVSVSQTGQIPSGTQTLLFNSTSPFYPPEPPEVFIGNDQLTLFPVGSGTAVSGGSYTVFGASISTWAGETEQLSFTVPGGGGNFTIDDISFSPTAVVPEPSPLALAGIGTILFALYRRWDTMRQ